MGSQEGSRRRQFPGDFEPSPATINAANSYIERLQATSRYSREVPSKQRVAGSNPAGRAQPDPSLMTQWPGLTDDAHDTLPAVVPVCVPDDLGPGRFGSAAAQLLSASAIACCRSSRPCSGRRGTPRGRGANGIGYDPADPVILDDGQYGMQSLCWAQLDLDLTGGISQWVHSDRSPPSDGEGED